MPGRSWIPEGILRWRRRSYWKPVPGANFYQVFIRDLWNEDKLIYTSELQTRPELVLPPDLLHKGGMYSWIIHARDTNSHILLGDFNIFKPTDITMQALLDNGFDIPSGIDGPKTLAGTNAARNKFYDQIMFRVRDKRFGEIGASGSQHRVGVIGAEQRADSIRRRLGFENLGAATPAEQAEARALIERIEIPLQRVETAGKGLLICRKQARQHVPDRRGLRRGGGGGELVLEQRPYRNGGIDRLRDHTNHQRRRPVDHPGPLRP